MSALDSVLLVMSLTTLAVVVVALAQAWRGDRTLRRLRHTEPMEVEACPSLCVVLAARNEADGIRAAMTSLFRQDYPGLEIVAVDDRSTDATGAILDELAAGERRLRVLHVDRLPPRWLGKNHALQQGASECRAEWILFTDADVVFEASALRRAMRVAVECRADHLVVAPRLVAPGVLLKGFVAMFSLVFGMYTQPWRIRDPRSRCSMGIGAFNLVRSGAWRAAGTHAAIAMRPDDDLALGKIVKRAGFRQDIALGSGVLTVEWYPSLRAALDGLMKNSFAGLGYSVLLACGAVTLLLLVTVMPFVALLVEHGPAFWASLLTCALLLAACSAAALNSGVPAWAALLFPLSGLIQAWILARATAVTLWRGEIEWRGTRYALSDLRRNRM